ncbi:MAG: hypothetical protein ACKVI4_17895, partial [Actinomycetales bacterium]
IDDGRIALNLAVTLSARITPGKARNGYAQCEVIERDGAVLAQVYGRSARSGEVHITVTSDACDEVVPILRAKYPEHRVSRADVAVDFATDFAALDDSALSFATQRNLSHRLFTSSDGGATRYIGSPRSEAQLRVYKKSEQLRSLHPESAHTVPDGIVRCELVIKPGKRELKTRVASMSADEVWGLSRWSSEFAGMVLGFTPERVPTHFRRPTDWARALHFLSTQYSPSVAKRVADVGLVQTQRELLEALGIAHG